MRCIQISKELVPQQYQGEDFYFFRTEGGLTVGQVIADAARKNDCAEIVEINLVIANKILPERETESGHTYLIRFSRPIWEHEVGKAVEFCIVSSN